MANQLGFLNVPPAMAQYVMQQQQNAELNNMAKSVQQTFAASPQVRRNNPYLPALAAAFAKLGGGIGQGIGNALFPDKTKTAVLDTLKKQQSAFDKIDFSNPSSIDDAATAAIHSGNIDSAAKLLTVKAALEKAKNPPLKVRDQKIADYVARGFDRSTAQDLADGKIVAGSPDPSGRIPIIRLTDKSVSWINPQTPPAASSSIPQTPQADISGLVSDTLAGTGPKSHLRQNVSNYFESLFSNKVSPETAASIKGRQAVDVFNKSVETILANNPRFPVAEMKLITGSMLPDTQSVFVDPNAQVLKLKQLQTFTTNKIMINNQLLSQGNLTPKTRADLMDENTTYQKILNFMGSFTKPSTTPTITNDSDYNALPSGTEFIAPDGTHRRKP